MFYSFNGNEGITNFSAKMGLLLAFSIKSSVDPVKVLSLLGVDVSTKTSPSRPGNPGRPRQVSCSFGFCFTLLQMKIGFEITDK